MEKTVFYSTKTVSLLTLYVDKMWQKWDTLEKKCLFWSTVSEQQNIFSSLFPDLNLL